MKFLNAEMSSDIARASVTGEELTLIGHLPLSVQVYHWHFPDTGSVPVKMLWVLDWDCAASELFVQDVAV